MGWEHHDVIGQGENLVFEAPAHRMGSLTCFVFTAEQVGAGDVVDQEGAAGKQDHRLITSGMVAHHQADMLGRMTGGMQHFELDFAHAQALAVMQWLSLIAQFGAGAGQELDGATLRQFADAGEIIIMLMRVGGVSEPHPLFAGEVEIGLDVATHIEDQGLTRVLRSYQIGGVAQAW
jgi:hypothetical protein